MGKFSNLRPSPFTLEVLCYIFSFSFVFAVLYYAPHAIDTALAWAITCATTFSYGFTLRLRRLELLGDYPSFMDNKLLKLLQFFVLAFLLWSVVNLVLAIERRDGTEPEGKWMTFIATMMGLKWSTMFFRLIDRIQTSEPASGLLSHTSSSSSNSRRALLSPIGEIA